ncbi:MAG: flagellar basal body P-ring protein FlgI [Spirochaetia bacterium]|nr:flagellar basal body P-ring protein FlgI [Spirochaetia bacterium]
MNRPWHFSRVPVYSLAVAFVLTFANGAALLAQDKDPAAADKGADAGTQTEKKDEGVRLKDLARISGIRSNQLLGYGIVVGLPGTGDSRTKFASEAIQNLLGNLGQKLEGAGLNSRNIAAVLVTAEVPPFARKGDRISVTVSSIGDAKSLEGGVLIQTPLMAGNSKTYGVAQGVVTTGGREEKPGMGRTVGTVMQGAALEQNIGSDFLEEKKLRISLKEFDFATLNEVRTKIKQKYSTANVIAEGGSILVDIPAGTDSVEFAANIEEIRIQPKLRARVVINERTGTIVMGGDIRIDPVAISRGGMQIIVTAKGQKGEKKSGSGRKEDTPVTQEFAATSVGDIIEALNTLGATVKDVIAILEALKDSGALHAELVVI